MRKPVLSDDLQGSQLLTREAWELRVNYYTPQESYQDAVGTEALPSEKELVNLMA